MPKKKKKVIKKRPKRKKERQEKIDVDQCLLMRRTIFLNGIINEVSSAIINRQLMFLDQLEVAPIILYINSGGGSISHGFSIIDTMNGISSPVITAINGMACSMAGIISVAGHRRVITPNGVWMAHDMQAYSEDYMEKLKDRHKFYETMQKRCFKFLLERTKLTPRDITKALIGELWLYPKDCLEKGIVDKVLK